MLELYTCSSLESPRTAGPECLPRTGTWLTIIRLIQHIVIASQICDVKKIEDLANQGYRHAFLNVELFSQANVLGDEAVAGRNVRRQNDRADDLVEWRPWPNHGLSTIGISYGSRK